MVNSYFHNEDDREDDYDDEELYDEHTFYYDDENDYYDSELDTVQSNTLSIDKINDIPYAEKLTMVITEISNLKGKYVTLVLDDQLKVSVSISELLFSLADHLRFLNE